jgi:hypothetical protein
VERSWPDRRSAIHHRSPIHPDLITDWFRRLARNAGLPPIRLHDVRHEGEPIVGWLNGLGVRASVFRYPCWCATPSRYTLSG